ncbi:hypothetical protein jhhlp_001902 [Lomentospora prolificans]|uniref:UV excision repair protein RAD23 n=1 Tax=Lomentospora prolificans TaxID=41688 RepID=A0A2N3NCR6_9PEZI|nr:hypothetical protein jhhlp_001902 [Lomentospora prolificans]
MKVTFKDLKQNKFTLEIEPTELISSVKQKISEEKGWDAKQQKLIYSGKILKDEETVESYKIEEKGFVVCMVNKYHRESVTNHHACSPRSPSLPQQLPPPPRHPGPTVASTPAAPAAPAAQPASQPAVPSTPTPARSAAPPADTPAAFNDPSALTVGAERDIAIANMVSMGFEQSQVEAAMRAAYFNPDRAVEYLLSVSPALYKLPSSRYSSLTHAALATGYSRQRPRGEASTRPAAAPAPASATGPAAAPQTATGGEEGNVNLFDLAAAQQGGGTAARSGSEAPAAAAQQGFGNLDFLRNNPQFQQLRQVVQQQPQMLEPILEQLGSGNPALAQLIANNPEQFLSLLGENADDDAPLPPGAQAIAVTEEERDAIERLCRLGFSRDEAAQAYFACDKNEELAANFLFDQPEDDDPPQ